MSKVEAVEQVLQELHLTKDEKYQLARWLQKDRLKREWQALFKRIDRRVKKYGPPPSEEEIVALCRQVRKELHERNIKSRS